MRLCASWSEEDSESDPEEEAAKQVFALTGICDSNEDSKCEERTFEKLVK